MTSTVCMEFSHFIHIAFNSFCHYLWSCPMVKPAPCSTSLLRFAISSFKDWIVSLALCSLSWAASTIFHAFSISYWDRSKKQESWRMILVWREDQTHYIYKDERLILHSVLQGIIILSCITKLKHTRPQIRGVIQSYWDKTFWGKNQNWRKYYRGIKYMF